MRKAVIIGSGIGGLATSLRLAHRGFQVTVLEKLSRPGGRSNLLEENGFRADTGPTILVMKSTFEELYRSIGQDLHQRLELVQLEPNYRIYYHDGTHIDLFNNMAMLSKEIETIQPGGAERVFRFLGEGARKYALGMDFVERNFDRLTDLFNPQAGLRLWQTQAHQNLYKQVAGFFEHDDKLTKAFSFHSMFLGLSPFDALAMYSLITYADLALGMWFPRGGVYRLVEDMLDLANEMGVQIRINSPVEEICIENGRVVGVRLESGEQVQADLVVSNADLPYTYRNLINPRHRKRYTDARLRRMQYACSGFILYLGVDRTYEHVRHQALYFSEDYQANLEAIFKTKTFPQDPSFHLSIPTVTDPSLAPPDHSLLYVLAPMPNLEADIDWDQAAPILREKLLDRLEELIDPRLREHIVWERQYRPTDWLTDINATLGTAFGSLSHGFFQSSYFRPHNMDRDIAGLYFVGQGTYPGIGMPMVIISSKLVTERILNEWTPNTN
ncbi:MAG TPA: phytoene desaturase family protein [Anaerolineales bacterium]|nr:phytoene desaturase family protein [Anaerolineales bacterium]